MRRNLAASLFEHGAVRTTPAKAKDVKPFVEKLISIARTGTLHARRQVIALLGDRRMADPENPEHLAERSVVQRLFDEIAPRYVDRPGGYTRLIRLPERRIGDSGQQVLLQLVEAAGAEAAGAGEAGPVSSRRRKRAARRAEAAKASAEAGQDRAEQQDEQQAERPEDAPDQDSSQAEGEDAGPEAAEDDQAKE